MTQRNEILAHLKAGKPISPLEALNEYGCFRLAARISDLKAEGHNIVNTNSHGKFARYKLIKGKKAA